MNRRPNIALSIYLLCVAGAILYFAYGVHKALGPLTAAVAT